MRTHIKAGLLTALGVVCVIQPAGAKGVDRETQTADGKTSNVPTVRLVQPQVRSILRVVGQPCFIESYERTAICPKLTAYIEQWMVDIGDKVKKGQRLATLFAPELLEDLGTKSATVQLNQERIEQARELVTVAEADVQAAKAHKKEAESTLAKQQTEAELLSKQAALAKAQVDVKIAKSALAVAQGDENRLKAWISYLTLTAPYDGVIVTRNANTFDLVRPDAGAPPIYVIDRTDIVRVFVDIPEQDAKYVTRGAKASVLAPAYRAQAISASVLRTSWALNVKSRTLRAELDLPNPNSQLLPGMYAFAKSFIERAGVRALPLGAVFQSGDSTFCWTYENGHARRTEIETGLSDGTWIEVSNRRVSGPPAASRADGSWQPIDGTEQVILGNLSAIADGAAVHVGTATNEPAVAATTDGRHASDPSALLQNGRAADHGGARISGRDEGRDHGMHDAAIALHEVRVELALEMVKLAAADVEVSEARLKEVRLILTKYDAEVDRWSSEATRLKREVDRGVVDPQVLAETRAQLKSSTASRDAAKASVETAEADLRFKTAKLATTRIDVKVARAALAVARSEHGQRAHPGTPGDNGRD